MIRPRLPQSELSLDTRGRRESAPKFYCPDWKETVQSVVSEGDVVEVLARPDSVAAKYGTCGSGGGAAAIARWKGEPNN